MRREDVFARDTRSRGSVPSLPSSRDHLKRDSKGRKRPLGAYNSSISAYWAATSEKATALAYLSSTAHLQPPTPLDTPFNMSLVGLSHEAIQLILERLDSTSLAKLYCTLDRRIQRKLSATDSVHLLIIAARALLSGASLGYFLSSLRPVREVQIQDGALLRPSEIRYLTALQPGILSLGCKCFDFRTKKKRRNVPKSPETSAPSIEIAADSRFPRLDLLLPQIQGLTITVAPKHAVLCDKPPKDHPDFNLLSWGETCLPKSLTSLSLQFADMWDIYPLIPLISASLVSLELKDTAEYPTWVPPLVTILNHFRRLEKLSLDGVHSVWNENSEDEAKLLPLPENLVSLRLGSWEFPLEFLEHPHFKSSSLIEFELFGCHEKNFNADSSLEEGRELEFTYSDIDFNALAPPSLTILRMRYDSFSSKVESPFKTLPLSLTEFSVLSTVLAPISFELFRPLAALRTLKVTPLVAIAEDWHITRASWHWEFYTNLEITPEFNISALPTTLASIHIIARFPIIFELMAHLPNTVITCPMPPIWDESAAFLEATLPTLIKPTFHLLAIAEALYERTRGKVRFTEPWDELKSYANPDNSIFVYDRANHHMFAPIATEAYNHTNAIDAHYDSSTDAISVLEDVDEKVQTIAQLLFRFTFPKFSNIFPNVKTIDMKLPAKNAADMFARFPKSLTRLDLHDTPLPGTLQRFALPSTLTWLSSSAPTTFSFQRGEWKTQYPLRHLDTPLWDIRATPYFLNGLSVDIKHLVGAISNIEDYNLVPFLESLSLSDQLALRLELRYFFTGALAFECSRKEGVQVNDVSYHFMEKETKKYLVQEIATLFSSEIEKNTMKMILSPDSDTIRLEIGAHHLTIRSEIPIGDDTYAGSEWSREKRLSMPYLSLPPGPNVKSLVIKNAFDNQRTWTWAPNPFAMDAKLSPLNSLPSHWTAYNSPGQLSLSFIKMPITERFKEKFEALATDFPEISSYQFLSDWTSLEKLVLHNVHPALWPSSWPSSIKHLYIASPCSVSSFGSTFPENLESLQLIGGNIPVRKKERLSFNLHALPASLKALHLEGTKKFMAQATPAKCLFLPSTILLRNPGPEFVLSLSTSFNLGLVSLIEVIGYGKDPSPAKIKAPAPCVHFVNQFSKEAKEAFQEV